MWFVNLRTQVRKRLGLKNGGTGNDLGMAQGIVRACLNRTGGTLAENTLVTFSHTYNDSRIIKTTTYQQTSVLGVVIGYYSDEDGQHIIHGDCPDGEVAAVQVSGAVLVLVGSEGTTRGEYAFASTTDGAVASSATAAAGAFGIVQGTATSGNLALVHLWGAVSVNTSSISYATPAVVLGSTAAAGAATTVIRSDSTIKAFDDGANPEALGTVNTGDDAYAARRDHVHPAPDLDDLTDVTITSPALDHELTYSGSAWVNRARADADKIWRPLMDGAVPGTIILDGLTGEAIMAYGPA